MIPRAVVYFLVMLMAAALALWAARWTAETGPLVVIAATSVAMFALIGTIDALVSLHWEPPRRI
jgi:hypothetical protein